MLTIEEIRTAHERSDPVLFGDSVSPRVELPFREMFYPLGFPVEVETNSEDVLRAFAESWQGFVKLFDTPPFRFRVPVKESDSFVCPPRPACRIEEHLISHLADNENYAISDFAQGLSIIWLTQAAVAHRSYLRYCFIEPIVIMQLSMSYTTPINAACIEMEGCGVLLCGDSGAGKSTLSYACALAGWKYITDDVSFLVNSRQDRLVVGNPTQVHFSPTARHSFPELAGRQITQRGERGKPCVELLTSSEKNIATSFISRVKHVVFLNRNEVKRQELVPFPVMTAKNSMLQRIFSLPEAFSIQSSMIDALLDSGALELRYTDLNWATERLGRLAADGN
jgi:hypothetical protein